MFSGKSTELIRRARRAKIANLEVRLFKPHRDTRSEGQIKTHDELIADADEIPPLPGEIGRSSTELLRKIIDNYDHIDVIAIDEFQFFDNGIVELCDDLANSGKLVLLAGLNLNFRGEPFGDHVAALLALADRIDLLNAICVSDGCYEIATRTQRTVNGKPAKWDDPIYMVGGVDIYYAVCRKHHIIDIPVDENKRIQYQVFRNRK